jgi:hypothetical protein
MKEILRGRMTVTSSSTEIFSYQPGSRAVVIEGDIQQASAYIFDVYPSFSDI